MPKTSPYRQILVATDFSEHAAAALAEAAWVAQHAAARLTLVHVLPDVQASIAAMSYELLQGEFGTSDESERFEKQRRQDTLRRLKEAAAEYRAGKGRIGCEAMVGTPFVEITHAAQREGFDLVVTGSRGHSKIKQFLLGSTTQRLVRKCPADVWVVKGSSGEPPKAILAAIDQSVVSGLALQRAAWLAKQSGAQLHVLHVLDSTDVPADILERSNDDLPRSSMRRRIQLSAKDHLQAFLDKYLVDSQQVEQHLSWGPPWKEIVRLAGLLSADLIVMGTVGRSGISGLLLGNVAERVLSRSPCSVLTVKPAGFVSPLALPVETPADADA